MPRGRRHAEAAVVVDRWRAQSDAGELPERVVLLVRQPAAAEHADRRAPVARLASPHLGDDPVERLVPSRPCTARRRARRASAGWSTAARGQGARAAVQPFWQRPPRLTGKSRASTCTRPRSSTTRSMPHCTAQIRAMRRDPRVVAQAAMSTSASRAPLSIASAMTSNAAAHASACSGRHASPAISANEAISTCPTTA
jgi:hypothetical protein